jgi:hypothetical protein
MSLFIGAGAPASSAGCMTAAISVIKKTSSEIIDKA